jgi:hypothetical protein
MKSRGRKGPGGSGDLQNRTDLPTAGWVGSIPTRSRHAAPCNSSRSPSVWLAAARPLFIVALAVAPRLVAAQQQDSARSGVSREVPPAPPPEATGPAPGIRSNAAPLNPRAHAPVSAKAAFLYSLLLPGLGQAKLDRSYAGALFFSAEALSFAMLRQAEIDLRYAQAHSHDSTLVVRTYQTDSLGQTVRDSLGHPIPATFGYARYDSTRVAARKTHVEDWIAALLFNHLISAADAFVAAQLWDLPAHVHPLTGMSADGRSRLYGVAVSF